MDLQTGEQCTGLVKPDPKVKRGKASVRPDQFIKMEMRPVVKPARMSEEDFLELLGIKSGGKKK